MPNYIYLMVAPEDIWGYLTSDCVVANSIGKLIVDNLDAAISDVISDTEAIEAYLVTMRQKLTSPNFDQDTDSLEAIREVCDSIVSAMSD